ncbi:thrombopoietin isoform X2 [Alligator mississippiensis]|uniref:thrombopoietin isoform X2 n=1 Tax=Alligator mississippiensis TaxID=8496 RepID=UPI002877F3FC|nr:thrombopoietin isoform X2 [Alligator mississippiensis]
MHLSMELQPFPGGWDLPCAVLGARGRGWDAGSLHHLPAGCSQSGPQALTPSLAGFSGLSHSRPASGPRCREAPGSRGRWEHRGAWRPQPVPGTWCLWHPTVRTPPARRAREEASGSRKPLAGQHSSLLLGEAQQEAVLGQPGAPAAWTRGPAGSRPPWPLARSRGAAAGRQEQDVAPRQPLSMELNRLLLLTAFLLHVRLSRMSPTRLVCDSRLIHKYIAEAKDMERRAGLCQELLPLPKPVLLPLVDFSLREWKVKTNETKRQEILCDLAMLADAVTAAQSHVGLECAGALLEQLYRKTSSFHLLLQTFSWQVGAGGPSCTPRTVAQSHPSTAFLAYRQLVQGKLRFLFHDLARESCAEGSPGKAPEPPSPSAGR